jgi:hypothetical protein
MNSKAKRPALLDLNSFMVKPGGATPDAEAPALSSELDIEEDEVATAPAKRVKAAPPPPEMFRTSTYFSRAVHDKLREIAFAERKTITDLINEGLDHVLTSRNYAPTAELRGKKR